MHTNSGNGYRIIYFALAMKRLPSSLNSPGLLASPVTLIRRAPLLLVLPPLFFFPFLVLEVSWSESLEEELLLDPLSLPEELESLSRHVIKI